LVKVSRKLNKKQSLLAALSELVAILEMEAMPDVILDRRKELVNGFAGPWEHIPTFHDMSS